MKSLSRNEMKNLMGGKLAPGSGGGGTGTCTATYTSPGGATSSHTYTFSGTCASQSSQANSACVNLLEGMNVAGDKCGYDCSCDGVGN